MATVSNILSYARRKYPRVSNTTNYTDAQLCEDLNDIHVELFVKLQRLTNQYKISNIGTTVANQLTYTLPTDCSIDNIIKVQVSNSVSEWDDYQYIGLVNCLKYGKYYSKYSDGVFSLLIDGEPIPTSGLNIQMFYYPNPTAISSSNLNAVPGLDVNYHSLLKYKLIQTLAESGESPDDAIAAIWEKKFNEFYNWVQIDLNNKTNIAPDQTNQSLEVW